MFEVRDVTRIDSNHTHSQHSCHNFANRNSLIAYFSVETKRNFPQRLLSTRVSPGNVEVLYM